MKKLITILILSISPLIFSQTNPLPQPVEIDGDTFSPIKEITNSICQKECFGVDNGSPTLYIKAKVKCYYGLKEDSCTLSPLKKPFHHFKNKMSNIKEENLIPITKDKDDLGQTSVYIKQICGQDKYACWGKKQMKTALVNVLCGEKSCRLVAQEKNWDKGQRDNTNKE